MFKNVYRILGVWIGFAFGIIGWELMRMGYPWYVYVFMLLVCLLYILLRIERRRFSSSLFPPHNFLLLLNQLNFSIMITYFIFKDFKGPRTHKIQGQIVTGIFELVLYVPVLLGMMGVI